MPSSVTKYERGDDAPGAGEGTRGMVSGGGRSGALKDVPGVSGGLTDDGGGSGAEWDGDGSGKV